MTWIVEPHQLPTIPVAGTDKRFAVRRVWCIGRNYADHAREMGGDPTREPPFFFAKPGDAVYAPVGDSELAVPYPMATVDLHHEVELVAAIGLAGRDLDAATALDHVIGYCVGVDLTRRDLQREAKRDGRPWAMAKGFDASAPTSALRLAATIGHPTRGAIELMVNDQTRQRADLADLIWSVAESVAALSRLVAIEAGDLLFTGTPSGVGPLARGDRLVARIEGVGTLRARVAGSAPGD